MSEHVESIVEKLKAFNSTLSEAEQANYKLLLGLAAGGLSPEFNLPIEKDETDAFNTVTDCLAKLQPYSNRISPNGIAFRGRPDFMTDELLHSLQHEARSIRKDAVDNKDHFLGCGAPIADEFSKSTKLTEFVRFHAGEVLPTGIASFIYYDKTGQGINPHIDTDIFSLNVLLMLEHTNPDDTGSCLVVFPSHSEPERINLKPGELVIMFAGSITHGREHIKENERVTILTFGFHPLGI